MSSIADELDHWVASSDWSVDVRDPQRVIYATSLWLQNLEADPSSWFHWTPVSVFFDQHDWPPATTMCNFDLEDRVEIALLLRQIAKFDKDDDLCLVSIADNIEAGVASS